MNLGTKVPISSVVMRNSAISRFSGYPGTGRLALSYGLGASSAGFHSTAGVGDSGVRVTKLLNQVRKGVLEAEVWAQRDEVSQVGNVARAIDHEHPVPGLADAVEV